MTDEDPNFRKKPRNTLSRAQAYQVQRWLDDAPKGLTADVLCQKCFEEKNITLSENQIRKYARDVGYQVARRVGGWPARYQKQKKSRHDNRLRTLAVSTLAGFEAIEKMLGENVLTSDRRLRLEIIAGRMTKTEAIEKGLLDE